MKLNKRTNKIYQGNLSPLTERILTRMGKEGAKIRRRLLLFYQGRQVPEEEAGWEPPVEICKGGWTTPLQLEHGPKAWKPGSGQT